jgi:23S rRNA pseudouridine1911/1915/1917 synthase
MPAWERLVEKEADRLDRWLHRQLPGYSLRQVRELIRAGRVQVRGKRAKKGSLVQPHDRVRVENLEPGVPGVRPEAGIVFEVVFEDESLAVVDKPAGMPTHPLDPGETGTLLNGALARWPELSRVGKKPLELGLIHRLDTKTSGLLLLAKTEPARVLLVKEMKARKIRKYYRAVVEGHFPEESGEIHLPLGHHPQDDRRMVAALPGQRLRGKPQEAITRFRVRERGLDRTLLELELVTGVTHQLRVHLASQGHPVKGDDLYGPEPDPASSRYLLQSWRMELIHPKNKKSLLLEARKPLTLND